MAITAQRRLFIEEYIKCRVGAEAARRAGYAPNSANVTASQLLAMPEIQEEIQSILNEKVMEFNEAVGRLADIARGSMEDFVSFNVAPYPEAILDLDKARERGVLHLIKKLKYDKDGQPEIELYSSADALKIIAELHKRGPSGREDDPLTIKIIEGPKDVR